MAGYTTSEVINEQRFQTLERELYEARVKVKSTEKKLLNELQVAEEVNTKNRKLAEALTTVQGEKLNLESELRQIQQRKEESGSHRSILTSRLTAQLADLGKKLDEALNSKEKTNKQIWELQSQILASTSQLEAKENEVKNLEQQLSKIEEQRSKLIVEVKGLEDKQMHHVMEIQQKLDQWLQKEQELTNNIQALMKERDELHIELEKKTTEFEELANTLKETTHALGNCISVIKKTPDVREALSAKGSEVDAVDEMLNSLNSGSTLSHRASERRQSHVETNEEVDDLSGEELRSRNASLATRLNREINASLFLENDVERETIFKNKAVAESASLKLQLSEAKKINVESTNDINLLQQRIMELENAVEEKEEARVGLTFDLESTQKTLDDYCAQVKFLITKLDHMKETEDLDKKGSKRSRTSPITVRAQTNRSESVHDVIEENRKLKQQFERSQAESIELKQQIDEFREASEKTITLGSPTQGTFPPKRHKRAAESSPELPEQGTEEDSIWKEKWEAAQLDLSTLRSTNVQLETNLSQALERASAEAMQSQKEYKHIEHVLIEYQAKYNALHESYVGQGDIYKSDIEARVVKIREMEALVKVISSELDSQKQVNEELQTALQHGIEQYENEQKAFQELQERMISTEAEHLAEMKTLKESVEAQMNSNLTFIASQSDTDLGMDSQKVVSNAPEIQALMEQLKDKEEVILELEKQLQQRIAPIEYDTVHDLKSEIALAKASTGAERHQKETLQKVLLNVQTQHNLEINTLKEEASSIEKDKDAKIHKLQLECEGHQLQLTNLKQADEEFQSTVQTLSEEHAELESLLEENHKKAENKIKSLIEQNDSLKTDLAFKLADLNTKMELITTLRTSGTSASERIRQLEKENNELKTKAQDLESKLLVAGTKPPSITEKTVKSAFAGSSSSPLWTDFHRDPIPAADVMTGTSKGADSDIRKEVAGASQIQSSEAPSRPDISSLLEAAKTKVSPGNLEQRATTTITTTTTTATTMTTPTNVSEGQHSKQAAGLTEEQQISGPEEIGGPDTNEGNKQTQKWIPIVYNPEKKPDQNDDKKKDRSSKF